MKNFILLVFMCFSLTGFAQEISVELDNFTKAEISKGLKVNFTQSDENKAIITGNSRNEVDLKVKGGVLIISVNLDHLWNEDNTIVNIHYKQLFNIEAKQNSKIDLCGRMKQPMLKIRVQEGSDVKANVEVENLYASVVTGGNLYIIGKATNQEIDVKAAGDFKGENLIGNSVEVSITGGGTASIFAKYNVKSKVRAGGTVYIYGNPKNVDEKTTFGGSIKRIN